MEGSEGVGAMTCSARGCRKNKKCDQCRRQTWKNIDDMQRAGFNRRRSRLFNKERIEYRRWLKSLRIGSLVAVCYDGKAGRAKAGRVERVLGKGTVWVRFTAMDRELRIKFVRGDGWDTSDGQFGIMRMLGLRGDFYSLKRPEVLRWNNAE